MGSAHHAVENQPASLEIETTNDRGVSSKLVTVDLSRTPIDPAVPPSIGFHEFQRQYAWMDSHQYLIRGVRNGVLVVTADAGRHWRVLRSLAMDGNISLSSASSVCSRFEPEWQRAQSSSVERYNRANAALKLR